MTRGFFGSPECFPQLGDRIVQRIVTDHHPAPDFTLQLLAADYGTGALEGIEGLTLIGTASDKAGVLSFVMDGVHPHDIGTILDMEGVAVRTGHHCAQPVMQRFGIPATTRASLGVYNTTADLDRLVAALTRVQEMFG